LGDPPFLLTSIFCFNSLLYLRFFVDKEELFYFIVFFAANLIDGSDYGFLADTFIDVFLVLLVTFDYFRNNLDLIDFSCFCMLIHSFF
jgi:hypothetical protein